MNNSQEPVLKMRFRLPNGEEFEAEGTREFIEQQRNYFLTLIGHPKSAAQIASTAPAANPTPALAAYPAAQQQSAAAPHSELYLWERILKEEGDLLIFRRKPKLSTPDMAAVILAGARVLLKQTAYSALELAKSLKTSGAEEGRLDRILAPELQAGRLTAQGAKRSRTYALTEEGFARAFVLAEKLWGER